MSARKPRRARTEEPLAPPMPPPTEREKAISREITDGLHQLARELRQRNLDNAVLLAQQAARGRGPLVEHFRELGRRFDGTLSEPPAKPKLRA